MKDIARMALEPGMMLGQDIYNSKGKLLYKAGTKVDENVIGRLTRHSIIVVSILEKEDFATTHFEKVRISKGFTKFEASYIKYLSEYKKIMTNFVEYQEPIDNSTLLDIHNHLSELGGSHMLDYLYNMVPSEDALTHAHCLNSALIAGVFADWLAMRQKEKETLILCAFFYDIGKLKLPYDLLWKPEKLSEEEYALVRTHSLLGFEMAKKLELDPHILKSILMHHERCDGTGYPARLKVDQIDVYARHIAIIDAYEAMTSARAYRRSMTPMETISRFEEDFHRYDETLLRPILKRISDSQIGLQVKLNDDSLWEIFIINPMKLSRPILKKEETIFLDLYQHPELEIVSIY